MPNLLSIDGFMDASPPYDLNPVADLVLHSSDDVFFYVLGSLLRFVSPIFRNMFAVNHGQAAEENERKNGLPVVYLEEDSETLRLLLDLIYPSAQEPQLSDASLLWRVGKATTKYFIDVVDAKLKSWTHRSKLIINEPLRVYAIAIDLGWEDVATRAAWRTLKCPLEDLSPVEELKNITGSDFYRFLEYRVRCESSTNKKAEQLMDLPNIPFGQATHPHNANLPIDAQEPFGSSPAANLVLRSSDSVDFYVLEGLMRLVSPHFDGLFPLNNPRTKDGRAVICVAEDSKTMHQLLSIIYHHTDEVDIQDFELYTSIVKAVRVYRMATIESKLRKQALVSHLAAGESLRMYALATTLQWGDVAKAAALNTLPRPLSEISYLKELSWITGADLYRLVSFRFRCGDAACRSLKEDRGLTDYGLYGSYRGATSEELFKKVKACPRCSTVDELYDEELEKIGRCNSMSINGINGNGAAFRGMMDCRSSIGKVIEEAISEVPLDMP
ncbi:hypothetical protein JOM56_007724 [Amanita muscaria]